MRAAPFGRLAHSRYAALLLVCACSSEVPLGSWERAGIASCQPAARVDGSLNTPGSELGATLTATDWLWAAAPDSIESELLLESRPARDGYFWASQFSFSGNPVGGFVGLQSRGGYQAEPPDGDTELTDMAVFWIGGAPLRAELGDVAEPDARSYAQFSGGTQWWTIHAKYELVTCRPYRLRVARQQQETNGDAWYGGWVRDTETNVETLIGRILVPAAWGALSDKSTNFSDRVGWGSVSSCAYPEYASARFGIPRAAASGTSPLSHSNRFGVPAKCSSSRVTELGNAVRHELGVPQ